LCSLNNNSFLLAFIGKDPGGLENVYVATSDSGMDMTHGMIAGILLTDLIGGRDNRWREIYDPSRKPILPLTEYAKENVNMAAQYAAWVTPGDVQFPDQIRPGEGATFATDCARSPYIATSAWTQ